MKRYEYIRLEVDMGDLNELNRLGSVGYHVVGLVKCPKHWSTYGYWILLERELDEEEWLKSTSPKS